jgi:ribosome-associated protein
MLLFTGYAKGAGAKHEDSEFAPLRPAFCVRSRSRLKELTLTQSAKSSSRSSRLEPLLTRILTSLDEDKAENIVTVDLSGRSSLCDAIVVASGRSQRHVAATAEHLARKLKEAGYGSAHIEGLTQADWVLVDMGDIIVHIFRPEVRLYYDLEGMWSVDERKLGATEPLGAAAG